MKLELWKVNHSYFQLLYTALYTPDDCANIQKMILLILLIFDVSIFGDYFEIYFFSLRIYVHLLD